MQISVTEYLILYYSYALDDRVDGFTAFQGITLILQQQICFKLDEICLILFNIFPEVYSRMFTGKRVGVFSFRQQQYLQVHSFGEQHVGSS